MLARKARLRSEAAPEFEPSDPTINQNCSGRPGHFDGACLGVKFALLIFSNSLKCRRVEMIGLGKANFLDITGA